MKITANQLRQLIRETLIEQRRKPSVSQRVSKIEDTLDDSAVETEARLDAIEREIEGLQDIVNMVTTEIDRADLPGMAPVSPKLRHQSRMGSSSATGLSMGNAGKYKGGTGPGTFNSPSISIDEE